MQQVREMAAGDIRKRVDAWVGRRAPREEGEGNHRRRPVGRQGGSPGYPKYIKQLIDRLDRLIEILELRYMGPAVVATLVEDA